MNITELEVYDLIDRIQDKLTHYYMTERYNAIVIALKNASKNRIENLEFDYEVNNYTRKAFDYIRKVIKDPEITDDDIKAIVVGVNDVDESVLSESKDGAEYIEKLKSKQSRGRLKLCKHLSLPEDNDGVVLPPRISIIEQLGLEEMREEYYQATLKRVEEQQNRARHSMESGGFKRSQW